MPPYIEPGSAVAASTPTRRLPSIQIAAAASPRAGPPASGSLYNGNAADDCCKDVESGLPLGGNIAAAGAVAAGGGGANLLLRAPSLKSQYGAATATPKRTRTAGDHEDPDVSSSSGAESAVAVCLFV